MLFNLLAYPLMLILPGFLLWRFPPKNINPLYGFRTGKSMQSQENWDFANKLAGKLFCIMGIINFLFNAAVYLLLMMISSDIKNDIHGNVDLLRAFVFGIQLIAIIILVQIKLKSKDRHR